MGAVKQDVKIAIVGLGYVGLPLAVAFSRYFPTLGFDVSATRIEQLKSGVDVTQEVESSELLDSVNLNFSADPTALADANFYIVCVPTPVNQHKHPDMSLLVAASNMVGGVLSSDDVVIYESTVYPGATEEICVPILEQTSGLTFNTDFYVGYSPERINPGDKEHGVTDILKVTSGSTPEAAEFIDSVYSQVITAGTHLAPSIKVAEAAKVIENTQRDINIALMNELAQIFKRVGIDTQDVLAAAATKWNFLPFKPGLVGGHCIGVDPYYLTHKAQELGYHPEVILAGRRINDGMGAYVAKEVMSLMAGKGIEIVSAKVLVMGFTFKENCPDIRNTRVIDVVNKLLNFNMEVDVYDPWADADEIAKEYGISAITTPDSNCYDAVILAVGHREFIAMSAEQIEALGKSQCVIYDVKSALPQGLADGRL
ncbi:Vi polysaccharide biosynthesis UDP-N-acetylglucosamine C-6 dehydrogenase TviB [Corallincola spongiicola]|uniref:Vi polysaccharide biosynthesis UDP-N-acetylglucosamine C-6 dehydrogenase TviB n=1 Tax=Corallincola spongiicola TaxID=2520508 RepID=A0ABY1WQ15_9GAMM|nr:Vi polysaccharide biosynthesis UDP-N-acetylglucosamine C-6 dehydrogenase TviB [Corallincola spongiicola]TAA46807.1 Vi polysaccharide biosynthesis UDP-N-acetylglucosamine C-6 dehydrogenase TviB [Corallincola spongiicola]